MKRSQTPLRPCEKTVQQDSARPHRKPRQPTMRDCHWLASTTAPSLTRPVGRGPGSSTTRSFVFPASPVGTSCGRSCKLMPASPDGVGTSLLPVARSGTPLALAPPPQPPPLPPQLPAGRQSPSSPCSVDSSFGRGRTSARHGLDSRLRSAEWIFRTAENHEREILDRALCVPCHSPVLRTWDMPAKRPPQPSARSFRFAEHTRLKTGWRRLSEGKAVPEQVCHLPC